jgi:hypothetical protein
MGKSAIQKNILLFFLIVVSSILISTIISLLFSGFRWFTSFGNFLHRTTFGISMGMGYGLGNWIIGSTTGRRLNWRTKLKRSNLISLLSFIFYGIFISVFLPFLFEKYVRGATGEKLRYSVILNAFVGISVDMIIISIYYSHYLIHFWKKSMDKYEALEQENLKAKYDALKSQVNPHFLFNSLNTLTGVVEQDQKQAVFFIKKLSDIYRYVLEQQDKELVEIAEELNFLENYIYLAKMRYGNGLHYQHDISSLNKYIVPLGLQVLVENSIKHNVVSDDSPLNIRVYEEGAYLVVSNNLRKKKTIHENGAIGLENLKNRYGYFTQDPVIVQNDKTNFTVKIPIVESLEL